MNIGLIGAGRIAEKHAKALAALTEGPHRLKFVGVYDVDFQKAQAFSEKFGVRHFFSIQDLVQCGELDLAVVLVPSGLHFEVAMELLSLRVPTLVEKPLTLAFSTAFELQKAFEIADVPLFFVMQNRLNDSIMSAKQLFVSGKLAPPHFALASMLWCRYPSYYLADSWRLTREGDGGVLWNQASHYMDLMINFMGDVEQVFAYGGNFSSPAATEDSAVLNLKFKSGALGSLVATTTVRPSNLEGQLTLLSADGWVRMGGHALNSFSSSLDESRGYRSETEALDVGEVYGNGHLKLYESIIQNLTFGEFCQFRNGDQLEVIAAIEAASRSIVTGSPVSLDEVKGNF